jgi:hypothetical protein
VTAVIDVNWPTVVLLLGIVGLSLSAVCFSIWALKPQDPYPMHYMNADPEDQPTATWKVPPQ